MNRLFPMKGFAQSVSFTMLSNTLMAAVALLSQRKTLIPEGVDAAQVKPTDHSPLNR